MRTGFIWSGGRLSRCGSWQGSCPPPKSVSKKKQKQMLEGEILPLKKPDMDNIVKVVVDALNGVAYHDDTQVILVSAKKAYSAMEGLDITVEEYSSGR